MVATTRERQREKDRVSERERLLKDGRQIMRVRKDNLEREGERERDKIIVQNSWSSVANFKATQTKFFSSK